MKLLQEYKNLYKAICFKKIEDVTNLFANLFYLIDRQYRIKIY